MRHSTSIIDKITISVDECVESIVSLYHRAAECMKAINKHIPKKQEPWWDNQCEQFEFAKETYKALRFFIQNNKQKTKLSTKI